MKQWLFCALSISLCWEASCHQSRKVTDKSKSETVLPNKTKSDNKKSTDDKVPFIPVVVDHLSDEEGHASQCPQIITSNLPGVSIRVNSNQCVFSSAQVANYIETAYELRIKQPLYSVRPHRTSDPLPIPWPDITGSYRAGCPRTLDASNIVIARWVAGATNERLGYCDCDDGRCGANQDSAKDIKPATYHYTYRWLGQVYWGGDHHRHWADSEKPLPPGEYEIRLRSNGTYIPEGETNRQPFHVETVFPITITP
jgi:hypothetical protein